MKCYNCDTVVEDNNICPNCHERIDSKVNKLESSQQILKKITNINEFARFFSMFYLNSRFILGIVILALAFAIFSIMVLDNTWFYFVGAIIVIVGFNYFLEMKKIELFYKDFENNGAKYYILWPLKVDKNTLYADVSQELMTKAVLQKRMKAFENIDPNELLHLNSNKIMSEQRPRLFMTNTKFSKMFKANLVHYLQSDSYDDESFIAVQGNIHGFLTLKDGVITLFSVPNVTKEYLKDNDVMGMKIPNNNEVKNKQKKK